MICGKDLADQYNQEVILHIVSMDTDILLKNATSWQVIKVTTQRITTPQEIT